MVYGIRPAATSRPPNEEGSPQPPNLGLFVGVAISLPYRFPEFAPLYLSRRCVDRSARMLKCSTYS